MYRYSYKICVEGQVKGILKNRSHTFNPFICLACISESFQNNFIPNTLLRIAFKNPKPVLFYETTPVLHLASFYVLVNKCHGLTQPAAKCPWRVTPKLLPQERLISEGKNRHVPLWQGGDSPSAGQSRRNALKWGGGSPKNSCKPSSC